MSGLRQIREGRRPRVRLEGMRFGMWTVGEYEGFSRYTGTCDCGTVKSVQAKTLQAGDSKSCGCAATRIRAAAIPQFKEKRAPFVAPTRYEPCYAG